MVLCDQGHCSRWHWGQALDQAEARYSFDEERGSLDQDETIIWSFRHRHGSENVCKAQERAATILDETEARPTPVMDAIEEGQFLDASQERFILG